MKYFTPETSKKLEEMGLEAQRIELREDWKPSKPLNHGDIIKKDLSTNAYWAFSTLDICEIENAKKLWGEEDKERDELWVEIQKEPQPPEVSLRFAEIGWENRLKKYITLSDEKRIKYVEDYLNITSDK